jgi:catechol 2,3-dioxygenase-like lactoylglutathione lyase family enzyme
MSPGEHRGQADNHARDAPRPQPDKQLLNIRVADIQAAYAQWSARGAEFLSPPHDRGAEIRCYLRDPDGHLIEVGQTAQAFLDQIG